MKINNIIMIVLGCLSFFALPASAETPLIEEAIKEGLSDEIPIE